MSLSAKPASFVRCLGILSALFVAWIAGTVRAAEPIKALFLGDKGHHRPADRFKQIEPVLRSRVIDVTYTEDPNDLNPANLGKYKALLVYANIDRITPPQA